MAFTTRTNLKPEALLKWHKGRGGPKIHDTKHSAGSAIQTMEQVQNSFLQLSMYKVSCRFRTIHKQYASSRDISRRTIKKA